VAGVFLVQHLLWLLDDAFIYFRYLDNFLFLKIGLVHNRGEFIEGFSSPFWVVVLGLFRATGLDYGTATSILGQLGYVLFWWLLVRLNHSLSPEGSPRLNFPLVFLSFNYGALTYFTSGLESPFVQVAAAGYALFFLRPKGLALALVALSPMIRHELAVPWLIAMVWLWVRGGRLPWRLVLATAVPALCWLLFRIYTYADLFPNTFYLKNELDLRRGWIYVHNTFGTYHLYFVLALFAALAVVFHYRGRAVNLSPRLLMLACAVPIVLYVVKIGGDARHYRYLAFPFCLLVCATAGLTEEILTAASPWPRRLRPILFLAVATVSFSFYPPQIDRHFFRRDTVHQTLLKINDSALHRQLIQVRYARWDREVSPEVQRKYRTEHDAELHTEIKASSLCLANYNDFSTRIIHSLGLTDAILARCEMPMTRPSHKAGLVPLAKDMLAVQKQAGEIGRGMYRQAVEAGRAAAWISNNLEPIEVIEKKIYNHHDWAENLRLALTFPGRLDVTTPAK
jgi:hypothetical protein